LSIPTGTATATFTAQAKKGSSEFSKAGDVERTATAVEAFAARLSGVPIIGHLAKASQAAASGIAAVARTYGFSKPTDIKEPTPTRYIGYTNLSSADGFDFSRKLTMDPKNELSVDGGARGLSAEDQLSFDFLLQREGLLEMFNWSTSNARQATLATIHVHPGAVVATAVTGYGGRSGKAFNVTPLAYTSLPFRNWTGTIRYRVRIVKSAYHSGRLRFAWDPNGAPTATNYNTNMSTIVDITAEGQDCFEFDIGWAQPGKFGLVSLWNYSSTPGTIDGIAAANGVLRVFVESELTVQEPSADVKILIFARAGDDFALANPWQGIVSDGNGMLNSMRTLTFTQQAGPPANSVTLAPSTPVNSQIFQVLMGENIRSVRELLKRPSYYRTFTNISDDTPDASATFFGQIVVPPFPFPSGFSTALTYGGYLSDSYLGSTTDYFNQVGVTPLSYFWRCFTGWKGSIRWKFCPQYTTAIVNSSVSTTEYSHEARVGRVMVNRNDFEGYNLSSIAAEYYGYITQEQFNPSNWKAGDATRITRASRPYTSGCQVFYPSNGEAVEFEVPDYTTRLYNVATTGHSNASSFCATFVNIEMNFFAGEDADFGIPMPSWDCHVSAGDDFSFYGFRFCPRIYMWDDIPTVPTT